MAIALADGISSSAVSQEASESAVRSFLEDYYCTSDAWSVKRSGQRVLAASNAWLHGQTQRSPHRHDQDRGYVCTFSAMVIKSTTAHLFHVGDSRIYRLHPQALEPLTEDHRVQVSSQQSYLARALGVQPSVDIDYLALPLAPGEVYLLATDGVYEHADAAADPCRAASPSRRIWMPRPRPLWTRRSNAAARTTSPSSWCASTPCQPTTSTRSLSGAPPWPCRPCWRPGSRLRATASCANCTPPAAATSTSPSTKHPASKWRSKFRRWTSEPTPPTSSAS